MKISHIVPTKLIEKNSGEFVMALANYLNRDEVNDYEEAITEASLPIVLDNGAFETGTADGVDDLIIKAKRLKPAYVFAPDTLFDAEQTKKGFETFEYVKEKQGVKFLTAVVIQADNLEDYLKEFQKYNADPRVSVIGLSYLAISYSMKYESTKDIPKTKKMIAKYPFDVFSDPDYTEDRIKMLKEINNLNLGKIKPVHLLGLGKSYEDILFAKENCGYCLYNDTSTCYMAAKEGLTLTKDFGVPGGKIKEKINIDENPSSRAKGLLSINANKIKKELCLK